MESWARRRQGKNLALNSFTPLPGYRGVGGAVLYCMCSINGDSTQNVQRQRSNSPFWTGAQTPLCTEFAGPYNSFNQSDEQLNAAAENNPEIHDYRGPCADVRRWIVWYFASCIRRVLTSLISTRSPRKSQWRLMCDGRVMSGSLKRHWFMLLHKVQVFGHKTCSSGALSSHETWCWVTVVTWWIQGFSPLYTHTNYIQIFHLHSRFL